MSDASINGEKDRGLAWVLGAGIIGLVFVAAVYLRFRMHSEVGSLTAQANLGNALAPAVAFLTLLAVVAARWSVQMQRKGVSVAPENGGRRPPSSAARRPSSGRYREA